MNTLTLVQETFIGPKRAAAFLFDLLVNTPNDVDMSFIEFLFNDFMAQSGMVFKPYFDLLKSADEKYLIASFDSAAEYFYDAINAKGMYQDKVEYLIRLTINF